MTAFRICLCLATLQLAACTSLPPHSYAEQSALETDEQAAPQKVNLELPSAPVETPDTATHELMVQTIPNAYEVHSNCQIGFEEIMAEAYKKIDDQRHM